MRRTLVIVAAALAAAAPASAGTTFLLDGRGWGHGIGMSQYGARGFAEAGWGHERILKHFYRGTEIRTIPPRPVRVLLLEGKTGLTVESTRPFRVVDGRGKKRALKPGPQRLRVGAIAAARFPLRYVPGAAPLVLDGKAYRGELLVHRVSGRLTVVNLLPLDRYLRGVVPGEMPDDWHPEALKAQAVVARSYALATLKPGRLHDLYADTRSQVYGGIEAESRSTNLAVGATAGRVVWWNGRVATTFYHSTSGGRTIAIDEAWPKAAAVPYLVSVPDPHDRISKHHRWGPLKLAPAEVGRALELRGVRDVTVARGPSGRVSALTVRLPGGFRTIAPDDFRRALGLRSTWFSVRVLRLERPAARARAAAGRPGGLKGFVRGLGRVRLERQVAGGAWTPVGRIGVRPDGRFSVTVDPKRTTSYRLWTPSGAGAAVTVRR